MADSLAHHISFMESFYGMFKWIFVFIKWVAIRPLPARSPFILVEVRDVESEWALLEYRHPEGDQSRTVALLVVEHQIGVPPRCLSMHMVWACFLTVGCARHRHRKLRRDYIYMRSWKLRLAKGICGCFSLPAASVTQTWITGGKWMDGWMHGIVGPLFNLKFVFVHVRYVIKVGSVYHNYMQYIKSLAFQRQCKTAAKHRKRGHRVMTYFIFM